MSPGVVCGVLFITSQTFVNEVRHAKLYVPVRGVCELTKTIKSSKRSERGTLLVQSSAQSGLLLLP